MSLSADQSRVILAAARRAAYRRLLRQQPADVEDLAQDVTLKVLAHQAEFDPGKAQWTTWVQMIADRTAIDLGRKRKPVQLAEGIDVTEPVVELDEVVERAAREIRRLLPFIPLRTRAVLAALHAEIFPPCAGVRAEFAGLFGISWEASRRLPEWRDPAPEFLARVARMSANTLIAKPLQRLRDWLAEKAPALGRFLHCSCRRRDEAS